MHIKHKNRKFFTIFATVFRLLTMVLFDTHNHSQFSFDGKRTSVETSARSALEKGLGGITFTDHYDFFVPPMKALHEDFIEETFDIAMQQEEIDRVQALLGKSHGFRIMKGIEIGMHEDHHADIRNVLGSNSFDQITASVHYLDGTDPFYGEYYKDKDWKRAYGLYLETILKEMTWMEDFDILAHYDYIVRYAPYEVASIKHSDFGDLLDEIFRYLIHNGKALEINTKSYRKHNGRDVFADKETLQRYRELGGEIISFGSDSHVPERVGDNFTLHAHMMKALGFRWSAHFHQRKLVQLPL